MAERYDSILIRVEIGNSRKLRRLTVEQRWCAVAGVWALAAKAPTGLRGYLLVTPFEAITEQDVAEQAGVKPSVARSTLVRMRELGMLELLDEGEYVHDWDEHQREPAPKKPSDSPEATAERKRKQREGAAERHADVTRVTQGSVTPLGHSVSRPPIKEKGIEEKKQPPQPPKGERTRDREKWRKDLDLWVQENPVTDELLAEWASVTDVVHARLGDGGPWLSVGYLHPHQLGECPVLGTTPSSAVGQVHDWALQALTDTLGTGPRLIDCQCGLTVERAA